MAYYFFSVREKVCYGSLFANVFAQDHSCNDSLRLQIHIQSTQIHDEDQSGVPC